MWVPVYASSVSTAHDRWPPEMYSPPVERPLEPGKVGDVDDLIRIEVEGCAVFGVRAAGRAGHAGFPGAEIQEVYALVAVVVPASARASFFA